MQILMSRPASLVFILSTVCNVVAYQYYPLVHYRRSLARKREGIQQHPWRMPETFAAAGPSQAISQARPQFLFSPSSIQRDVAPYRPQLQSLKRGETFSSSSPGFIDEFLTRIAAYGRRRASVAATATKSENCRVQKCMELLPVKRSAGVPLCYAFGDPHTVSFDDKMNDYQGTCKHVLVKVDQAHIVPFTVYTKSKEHQRTGVSVPMYIEVEAHGQTIYMGAEGVLRVNGRETAGPYIYPEGTDCTLPCKIFVESNVISYTSSLRSSSLKPIVRLSLRTDFGLTATFKGDNADDGTLYITPPLAAKGYTKGLCGVWNGNKDDDFTMKNGQITKSSLEFGNSWVVHDATEPKYDSKLRTGESSKQNCGFIMSCKVSTTPKTPNCSVPQMIIAERTCSLLLNKTGVFKNCLGNDELAAAAVRFHHGCLFDVCATTVQNFAVSAMEEFALKCQETMRLVHKLDWQTALRAHLAQFSNGKGVSSGVSSTKTCQTGMHYDAQAKSQPTCENQLLIRAREGIQSDGACVCDGTDKVYDIKTKTCINKADCGCKDTLGALHKTGSTWISIACNSIKTCNPDRSVSEVAFSCPTDNVCGTDNGRSVCTCRQGFVKHENTCREIDECTTNPKICGDHGDCVNIPGSYACACHAGYHAKPNHQCVKIAADANLASLDALSCNNDQYKAVAKICSALLLDSSGPFQKCLTNQDLAVAAQTSYRTCVSDKCSIHSTAEQRNYEAVGVYADVCQTMLRIGTIEWRSQVQVLEQRYAFQTVFVETKECKTNMHFVSTAAATPTCEAPKLQFATGTDQAAGACVCVAGMLYDSVTAACILASNCGCVDNGIFHKPGRNWLTSQCQIEKICNADNSITERLFQCPTGQSCAAIENEKGSFHCTVKVGQQVEVIAINHPPE